ncbi:MAG: DUF1934 domain-containing protein [Oscillospiraceae bacterium]|nr:DUF1934 domain-containing protein [Oscillospiraceae bacterium]MBQ8881465.1 DUF1934 domain-containing protein [Oscillospiraceae bacterium]
MKKKVMLSIQGKQSYMDQEPENIELVTEGILEDADGGWKIAYAESDLTGMDGVETTFHIKGDTVTLTRTGKLRTQMVFKEGVSQDSLYRMEFGALMLTVCATRVETDLTENGGTIDLSYNISVEHSAAGVIDYHLDIKAI